MSEQKVELEKLGMMLTATMPNDKGRINSILKRVIEISYSENKKLCIASASKESRYIAAQCWCDPETESIEMDAPLAEAFAKRLDQKQEMIDELQDFAIWMTGCGYEFTQHEFFNKQRDKLLKTD